MTYLQYFLRKKTLIGITTAVVLITGLVLTLRQPFEYRSTAQMIVVHENEGLDSYTASRAAERSATTLSHVVATTSFFESVLAADAEIQDVFGETDAERRKHWTESISVSVTPDTGVLILSAYSESPTQAEKIVSASAKTLATHQWRYLGAGTSAAVELIDAPFTSTGPVRPNVPLMVGGSLIVGVMFGMALVILRDPQLRGADVELTMAQEKVKEAENIPAASTQQFSAGFAQAILATVGKSEAKQSEWALPKHVRPVKQDPPSEPFVNAAVVSPELPFEEVYAYQSPGGTSITTPEMSASSQTDDDEFGLPASPSQGLASGEDPLHDRLKRLRDQARG